MVKGKIKRRLEMVKSKTNMANIELKVVKGKKNNINKSRLEVVNSKI